jgi:hypothetical protein
MAPPDEPRRGPDPLSVALAVFFVALIVLVGVLLLVTVVLR